MSPKFYRKKPLVVQAMQWDGDNEAEIAEWVRRDDDLPGFYVPRGSPVARLWVEANNVWVPVAEGEWILKDSAGWYPCTNKTFLKTYEDAQPESLTIVAPVDVVHEADRDAVEAIVGEYLDSREIDRKGLEQSLIAYCTTLRNAAEERK